MDKSPSVGTIIAIVILVLICARYPAVPQTFIEWTTNAFYAATREAGGSDIQSPFEKEGKTRGSNYKAPICVEKATEKGEVPAKDADKKC